MLSGPHPTCIFDLVLIRKMQGFFIFSLFYFFAKICSATRLCLMVSVLQIPLELVYIWLLIYLNTSSFSTYWAFCVASSRKYAVLEVLIFTQLIIHYPMGMGKWVWINLGRV